MRRVERRRRCVVARELQLQISSSNITNCGETVLEINKAIILLNAIPDSFKEVKNAIKYGRETLTPDIVIDSLKSKKRELKFEKNERKKGEVHFVRGRSQSGNGNGCGDLPCLESEKQQETIREESLVEVEKVSIHISITLSEVESDTHQNQRNIDAEGNEDVIEENSVDQNPLANDQLDRDRERRPCREPQNLSNFTIAYASYQELVDKEPNTYVEAIKSEKSVEWFSTMRGEMSSFVRNQTWDLVPKPKNKSIVGCKWVYKVKEGTTESEHVRYEARLIAKEQWYRMFDSHVFYIGYKKNEFDNCMYYLHHSTNDDCVYLLLYVVDMLLDGPNMKVVNKISVELSKESDMKYLGHSRRFIGMKIDRDMSNSCLFVYQTPYVLKILKKSPVLAFIVSILCRYMFNPGPTYWEALKLLLRYLKFYNLANMGTKVLTMVKFRSSLTLLNFDKGM
ncbi:Retrovirus-related Pol polyprotein from transposon TNT 1-94 [Abeliophyllum distichum]|uniref:Retrovirus-related Pol polyprotein from transposon TNT 1-94 n=1 Tax=Abeliophyllum distichum TaxID=126358 RepID=A0ABD1Q6D5_9LAMI